MDLDHSDLSLQPSLKQNASTLVDDVAQAAAEGAEGMADLVVAAVPPAAAIHTTAGTEEGQTLPPPPSSPARARAKAELDEAVSKVQAAPPAPLINPVDPTDQPPAAEEPVGTRPEPLTAPPSTIHASKEKTTMTTAPISPPPPPPDTAYAREPEPERRGGCLSGIGGVLLGALLGIALTLGALLLLNGGLSYAPRSAMSALQATVTAYENNAATLRGDLSTLQGSMTASQDEVGTLQNDIAALATMQSDHIAHLQEVTGKVDGLQASVATVSDTVEIVASDVATLTEQMVDVSANASRAQRFMTGMQALLASVLSDEPAAPVMATPALTTTPTLTATLTVTPEVKVPVTATVPLTTTAPLTATVPLTATPTLTVTTAPTATLPVPTEAPIAPPAGSGSLRGTVYLDADRSGTRGEGEQGIADARVTLYTRNRAELAQTTTNAQGAYEFNGLAAGIYIVVQNDLSGYTSSTPNVLTVVVRGNRTIENVNFGDYRR
ncbi:MAG: SdrD B-like domain-containing protein [Caldilineales bacterium]